MSAVNKLTLRSQTLPVQAIAQECPFIIVIVRTPHMKGVSGFERFEDNDWNS